MVNARESTLQRNKITEKENSTNVTNTCNFVTPPLFFSSHVTKLPPSETNIIAILDVIPFLCIVKTKSGKLFLRCNRLWLQTKRIYN